jgi:putative glycosyltransferase
MDLSIVTTLYRSSPYVREFHRRASTAAAAALADCEFVFVNDGSPDDAADVAIALRRDDPRVVVVDLSRNFGHHKAMMTGLAHARGRLVFLIDCDLEEAPEWLGRFHHHMQGSGADVVFGQQARRRGGWFERASGTAFYRAMDRLSDQPMPPNQVVARLMTRRYVDALLAHRDHDLYIDGLWAATGFRQDAVAIEKLHKGTSSYSLPRKLALAVNAVTSFSSKPLVLISYLGVTISAVSIVAACGLVVGRAFVRFDAGWPSLIVSIWFLGGLTILCLGVIGLYVAKIFTESKDRPYTIVRQVHGREQA